MNAESVLDALNDFERKPSEIPPILDDYLLRIAQNGEIVFPWCKLKPLLKRKLEVVLEEFYESCPVEITAPVPNFESFNYDSLKKTILQAVDAFTSAPFTIQRICELVTNPKKHYNRTDKYMRGIEKNVLVVSTNEPRIGVHNDANDNDNDANANQGSNRYRGIARKLVGEESPLDKKGSKSSFCFRASDGVKQGQNANDSPIVNGMISESPNDENDCFNGHENNENESANNLNTPANHVLLDNFANVFPSAACIPSPSNICINREIDSNFIPGEECVESQEDEFSSQVSMEPTEGEEPKEEQMDTTSEEQQSKQNSSVDDNCEVTTAEAEPSAESEDDDKPAAEEQDSKIDEPVEDEVSETVASEEANEHVSDSEDDVKNEADCSESTEDSDVAIPEKETVDSTECQQDDTISQSDDNTNDASEVLQTDEACDTCEATATVETPTEATPEVSQSAKDRDSSEQCMELESSTDEPSV